MTNDLGVERMFSVLQVALLWGCDVQVVRKIFRGRQGVVNVGGRGRPAWRIPQSLLLEVMRERGYGVQTMETVP